MIERLRDSRGVVMPVTVTVMAILAGLGTVAANSGIMSSHQTFRDSNVKRASAAAAAGVKAALYATNVSSPGNTECVRRNSSTQMFESVAVNAQNWCPIALTEDLGANASYSVFVSGGTESAAGSQTIVTRTIVSTGTVNGVKRRVKTTATAATGAPLFGDFAISSEENLLLQNNVRVGGHVRSNQHVQLSNNAEVCGTPVAGPGHNVTFQNNAHLCPQYAGTQRTASQKFPMPFLDPGVFTGARAQNDNGRIGAPCVPGPCDPWGGLGSGSYNPTTKVLLVQNNKTLTLTGSTYYFCRISLENNARLIIGVRPEDSPLKIYIGSPEDCGGQNSGMGSVRLQNNAGIQNLNSSPVTLQLYLQGSPNQQSQVSFENNFGAAVNMVIHAPHSNVLLQNNVQLVGAIIARRVGLSNNSSLTYHQDVPDITTGHVDPVFFRQAWIECTSENAGATPDAGC